MPVASRLKKHVEHILVVLIVNWEISRVEHVIFQLHRLWDSIVVRNVFLRSSTFSVIGSVGGVGDLGSRFVLLDKNLLASFE